MWRFVLLELPLASGPEKIGESAAQAPESGCRARVRMTFIVLLLRLGVGVLVVFWALAAVSRWCRQWFTCWAWINTFRRGRLFLSCCRRYGLGALRECWKQGQVDLRAGILCALGMFVGAYGGSLLALPIPSRHLQGLFGCFLVLSAILLWRRSQLERRRTVAEKGRAPD